MKNLNYLVILLCATFFLNQSCKAQVSEDFVPTEIKIGDKIQGDLSAGEIIELDWAQLSNVACFPGNKFFEFQGNHVFYRLEIEPKSTTVISLTPLNSKDRINLYALRNGSGNINIPPDVQRAISCEAAYPAYHGEPNLNIQSETKEIEFDAINKPYTILIGVAGARDVLEGAYELSIRKK